MVARMVDATVQAKAERKAVRLASEPVEVKADK